jgi:uncharacterized protein DUF1844
MAMDETQENQGFKVKDQRRFNPDGSVRAEGEPEAPGGQEAAPGAKPPPEAGSKAATSEEDVLPADFVTLILSLASTAQMGLGVAPHPATGKPEKNLLQARHAIDLLGVLQEKTKGNLTKEEAKLLEALLSDLRMSYVEAKQKG